MLPIAVPGVIPEILEFNQLGVAVRESHIDRSGWLLLGWNISGRARGAGRSVARDRAASDSVLRSVGRPTFVKIRAGPVGLERPEIHPVGIDKNGRLSGFVDRVFAGEKKSGVVVARILQQEIGIEPAVIPIAAVDHDLVVLGPAHPGPIRGALGIAASWCRQAQRCHWAEAEFFLQFGGHQGSHPARMGIGRIITGVLFVFRGIDEAGQGELPYIAEAVDLAGF